MTMRWMTWATWIPAVAAMTLAVGWAMTGSYPLAAGAVICIALTLAALWFDAGDDGAAPHPLDPAREQERRIRLAVGQMRQRYRHTRDGESGL
jgi:hypothetical protein